MARLKRDPEFATAMLCEGVHALLNGEPKIGRELLRDYINAKVGFEKLGKKVGIPPKSLMRMFGSKGNPSSDNLLAVIDALKVSAGIDEYRVAAE
ncbi:MAG TPA: transcriptional regulator [Rhizomicrobium sp.]|nr:transcriptional regulator [Rhizomicrobium sp.]